MYSSIISEKKVDCRSAIQPPVSSCAPSKSASLLIYLIALIALCIPSNGLSHPLGNFSINRYSRLEPGAGYLNVYYVVDMAEIPTLQEKKTIDTDQYGQISDKESLKYLAQMAAELPQGLRVLVNNKPVRLNVRSKDIFITSEPLFLPTLRIELALFAPLPVPSQAVPLDISYEDNNYSQRLGWKEIVARAGPSVEIREASVPESDVSNALRSYPEEMLSKPPDVRSARITVVAGTGPAVLHDDRPTAAEVSRGEDRFIRLIKTKELTPRIYLIALLISLGLGAMHALSPGHGKSIVAAYLVGTRGTVKHAVFLGSTVTLTHTIGVFALGFITLFASRYILPEKLYPWLSLGSGVIVVVIGAAMLVKRIRETRYQGPPNRQQIHESLHHDHGDHSHSNPGHSHHDHDYHHHGHSDHIHDGNLSDHSHHDHNHGHTHLPPGADGEPVSWRSLLALGITGGILPCPSALVVLLAAISLQRIGFGMILIFAFSIGLAAVLTAIGLLFVKARQLLNRVPTAGPVMKILPAASAFVIMILGTGITVNALAQMF